MDKQEREQIYIDLMQALPRQDEPKALDSALAGGDLWFHFTDWNGVFDLPRLEKEGIIEFNPSLRYQPNNTWQDHFPPSAYKLTLKGVAIVLHTGVWVFDGLTDLDMALKDRRIAEVRWMNAVMRDKLRDNPPAAPDTDGR